MSRRKNTSQPPSLKALATLTAADHGFFAKENTNIPEDLRLYEKKLRSLPAFLKVLIKNGKVTVEECKTYLNLAAGLHENFNMTDLVQYSEPHEAAFPKFIYCALQNPRVYQRLVRSVAELRHLGEAFPQHAEALKNAKKTLDTIRTLRILAKARNQEESVETKPVHPSSCQLL